jgi:hypothetical protein
MSQPQVPVRHPVSIVLDGITYEASYTVEEGMVSVSCGFGQAAIPQGGSPAEVIARFLLSELIRKSVESWKMP